MSSSILENEATVLPKETGSSKNSKHNNSNRAGAEQPSQPSKSQIKKWKYLFNNLYRAMDTLYFHIEEAGDEEQCSNALFYLAQSRNALMVLVERIQNQKQYEQNPSYRGSVAWDVRRPSAQYSPYAYDPLPAPYNSYYPPVSGSFNPVFQPTEGDQHPAWLFPERPVPYQHPLSQNYDQGQSRGHDAVNSGSDGANSMSADQSSNPEPSLVGDLKATAAVFQPLNMPTVAVPVTGPVAVPMPIPAPPMIIPTSPEKAALRVKEAQTTQKIQQKKYQQNSSVTVTNITPITVSMPVPLPVSSTIVSGSKESTDAAVNTDSSSCAAPVETDKVEVVEASVSNNSTGNVGSSAASENNTTGATVSAAPATWASIIGMNGLQGLVPPPIQAPGPGPGSSQSQVQSGRSRSNTSTSNSGKGHNSGRGGHSRSSSIVSERDGGVGGGFRDFPMNHSAGSGSSGSSGSGASGLFVVGVGIGSNAGSSARRSGELTLGELMDSTGEHSNLGGSSSHVRNVRNSTGNDSLSFLNELHTLDEERRLEYDRVFREAEDWIESRLVAEESAWNDIVRNRIENSPNRHGNDEVPKPPGLNQDLLSLPPSQLQTRRSGVGRAIPLPPGRGSYSVFGDTSSSSTSSNASGGRDAGAAFAEYNKTAIVSSSLVSLIGGSNGSLLNPDDSRQLKSKQTTAVPIAAATLSSLGATSLESDLAMALGSPPPIDLGLNIHVDTTSATVTTGAFDSCVNQLKSTQPTNLADSVNAGDSDLSPFGEFLADRKRNKSHKDSLGPVANLNSASSLVQRELTSAVLYQYGSESNCPSGGASPCPSSPVLVSSHRRWRSADDDSAPGTPVSSRSSPRSSLQDSFTPTSRTRSVITPTLSVASSTSNSVGGGSSSSHYRSLHEKLSSPDRKKAALSPENARFKQEQRQLQAELNRERSLQEKAQRAMLSTSRAQLAEERCKQQQMLANQSMEQKMQGAEQRRDEHIKSIKGKAYNENAKVSEVAFINSMNEDQVQHVLSQKLLDVEKRCNDAAERRAKILEEKVGKNKNKHNKMKDQQKQLKLKHEQEVLLRLNAIHEKMRLVQERRDARLAEIQHRAEKNSTPSTPVNPTTAPTTHLFSPDSGDNLNGLAEVGGSEDAAQEQLLENHVLDLSTSHSSGTNAKRKRKKNAHAGHARGHGHSHGHSSNTSGTDIDLSIAVGTSAASADASTDTSGFGLGKILSPLGQKQNPVVAAPPEELFRQYLVRSFGTVCCQNTHTHDTNLSSLLVVTVHDDLTRVSASRTAVSGNMESAVGSTSVATGKRTHASTNTLSVQQLAVLISGIAMDINSLTYDQLQTLVAQCKTSNAKYATTVVSSSTAGVSNWIGKVTDILKTIFKEKAEHAGTQWDVAGASNVDGAVTEDVGESNAETTSLVANYCVISYPSAVANVKPKEAVKLSKRVALIDEICSCYVDIVTGLRIHASVTAVNAGAGGSTDASDKSGSTVQSLLDTKTALFTHMSVLMGILLQHVLDSSFGISRSEKADVLVDAMMGSSGTGAGMLSSTHSHSGEHSTKIELFKHICSSYECCVEVSQLLLNMNDGKDNAQVRVLSSLFLYGPLAFNMCNLTHVLLDSLSEWNTRYEMHQSQQNHFSAHAHGHYSSSNTPAGGSGQNSTGSSSTSGSGYVSIYDVRGSSVSKQLRPSTSLFHSVGIAANSGPASAATIVPSPYPPLSICSSVSAALKITTSICTALSSNIRRIGLTKSQSEGQSSACLVLAECILSKVVMCHAIGIYWSPEHQLDANAPVLASSYFSPDSPFSSRHGSNQSFSSSPIRHGSPLTRGSSAHSSVKRTSLLLNTNSDVGLLNPISITGSSIDTATAASTSRIPNAPASSVFSVGGPLSADVAAGELGVGIALPPRNTATTTTSAPPTCLSAVVSKMLLSFQTKIPVLSSSETSVAVSSGGGSGTSTLTQGDVDMLLMLLADLLKYTNECANLVRVGSSLNIGCDGTCDTGTNYIRCISRIRSARYDAGESENADLGKFSSALSKVSVGSSELDKVKDAVPLPASIDVDVDDECRDEVVLDPALGIDVDDSGRGALVNHTNDTPSQHCYDELTVIYNALSSHVQAELVTALGTNVEFIPNLCTLLSSIVFAQQGVSSASSASLSSGAGGVGGTVSNVHHSGVLSGESRIRHLESSTVLPTSSPLLHGSAACMPSPQYGSPGLMAHTSLGVNGSASFLSPVRPKTGNNGAVGTPAVAGNSQTAPAVTPAVAALVPGSPQGQTGAAMHVHTIPPVLLHYSEQILKTVNNVCAVDLALIQSIPRDIQVILAHTIEKAMSICIKVIEIPISQRATAFTTAASAATTVTSASVVSASSKTQKGRGSGLNIATGANTITTSGAANAIVSKITPGEEYDIAVSTLSQLMRLITALCVDNPSFQRSMFSGAKSSILLKLCQLPVRYISNELYKVQLLPALMVLCLNCSSNYNLYKTEMSPAVITEYIARAQAYVAYSLAGTSSTTAVQTVSVLGIGLESESEKRQVMVELTRRIPMQFWSVILRYFSC